MCIHIEKNPKDTPTPLVVASFEGTVVTGGLGNVVVGIMQRALGLYL